MLGQESLSQRCVRRGGFAVVVALSLRLAEDQQVEEFKFSGHMVREFAKAAVDVEAPFRVQGKDCHRRVAHERRVAGQPDRSVRLGERIHRAKEQPRVVDQETLGIFLGKCLPDSLRPCREVRIDTRCCRVHRREHPLFGELRAGLVIARSKVSAEVGTGA
jgi:hypothetical protein